MGVCEAIAHRGGRGQHVPLGLAAEEGERGVVGGVCKHEGAGERGASGEEEYVFGVGIEYEYGHFGEDFDGGSNSLRSSKFHSIEVTSFVWASVWRLKWGKEAYQGPVYGAGI